MVSYVSFDSLVSQWMAVRYQDASCKLANKMKQMVWCLLTDERLDQIPHHPPFSADETFRYSEKINILHIQLNSFSSRNQRCRAWKLKGTLSYPFQLKDVNSEFLAQKIIE